MVLGLLMDGWWKSRVIDRGRTCCNFNICVRGSLLKMGELKANWAGYRIKAMNNLTMQGVVSETWPPVDGFGR